MTNGKRFLKPAALSRLRNLKLIARTVVEGFISGLHRSPYQGFSVEFAEYREYSPGDDLKHFDWRAYGRTERHYIKLYQEETNLKCYILLDCSASMAYKSNGVSKFEYGCYLAASLAYLLVRQKDAVGLALFDEKVNLRMPPRASFGHLHNILIQLERAEPSKKTGIASALHAIAENTKRRGLMILISDLFENPDEVMRGIRHLRHDRHEVIVFHLLDVSEIEFPFSGNITFEDMETGEKVTLPAHLFQKEYAERLESFRNEYRKRCAEDYVDYVPVRTDEPFDRLLAHYLAKRLRL
ncbi:MAG: DUF58 domain-containing protein [Planctomycetota bacterium]|nr:DUF58 domain-containing protein [Planctomycetota bacterium]